MSVSYFDDLTNAWCSKCGRAQLDGCALCTVPLDLDKAEEAIEPWKPCPLTVRACIEALPVEPIADGMFNRAIDVVRHRLEAMLPDPAATLVEEYRQTFVNPDIVATHMDDEMAFACWLIDTGRVK